MNSISVLTFVHDPPILTTVIIYRAVSIQKNFICHISACASMIGTSQTTYHFHLSKSLLQILSARAYKLLIQTTPAVRGLVLVLNF